MRARNVRGKGAMGRQSAERVSLRAPLVTNFRCYDNYRLAGVPTWHAMSGFPIGGSVSGAKCARASSRIARSKRFSQMTRLRLRQTPMHGPIRRRERFPCSLEISTARQAARRIRQSATNPVDRFWILGSRIPSTDFQQRPCQGSF